MEEKNKIEVEGLDDEIASADTTTILRKIIVNENEEDHQENSDEKQEERVEDLFSESKNEDPDQEESSREIADVSYIDDDEETKGMKQRLLDIKDHISLNGISNLWNSFKNQKAVQSEANRISSGFRAIGITMVDYIEDIIGLFVEHNYQSELIYSNSTGHQAGYFLFSHLLMMIPAVAVCLAVQARNKINFLKIPVMSETLKASAMLCLFLFGAKLLFAMLLKIYENVMNHHNYGYLKIIKMINIQEMVLLPFLLAGCLFYALSIYYSALLYVGLALMGLGVIVSYQVMSKMMIRFRVMLEEKLSYNILLPVLVSIYYGGCGFAVYKMFSSFLELVIKGLLK